jgi:PAS domain S-box-containing protein
MFQKPDSTFKTIFETLPTAAVFTRIDGEIIKCNQAALILFEKDFLDMPAENECSGLTCLTGHPVYSELICELKEKGVLKNVEVVMITAKGKEFLATISADVVKGKKGKPQGIVFAIKDITDLKRKEIALKHRIKLEKTVASISTQLIIESDLDKIINKSLATISRLTHANRGYIFLTDEESKTISNTHEWCSEGVKPQKELLQNLPLSGFPWWIKTLRKGKIIHIEDTTKMPKKVEEERRLLLMQDIKSLLVLPLFLSKQFEGFVGFDNVQEKERWTDENIALVKIYGDILGKALGNKKAIDALQKSEKRFSDIAYSTGDWIWEIDINGYYTYSNIAVEEILGYSINEVIGKPFYDFYFLEEQEKPKKEEFERFFSKKEFRAYENKQRHKNGSTVFLETSATPIFGSNGFEGYRGTNHDITEKKVLENQLAEYSEDLEVLVEERTKQLKETQALLVKSERFAAIGELAGMVGHDIRNPLTSIKNAAYYLESKGNTITDDKRNVMLSIINKSINQANKIVNDLLDYSREINLELTEVTPKAVLQNALENIPVPEYIQILDNTKEEHKMTVDSAKLERVFVNLINNAIEAMPTKGTITISSKINNEKIDISFTDTGVGISKENKEKMFAPLFTTKSKGMGLGLAICKRIVEAHCGKITVESTPGKGTTFLISLPLKPTQKNNYGNENLGAPQQEFLLFTHEESTKESLAGIS